jgi:hypothetical protein
MARLYFFTHRLQRNAPTVMGRTFPPARASLSWGEIGHRGVSFSPRPFGQTLGNWNAAAALSACPVRHATFVMFLPRISTVTLAFGYPVAPFGMRIHLFVGRSTLSLNLYLGGELGCGPGHTSHLLVDDACASCGARGRLRRRAKPARPIEHPLPELSYIERMEADPQCS